MEITIKGNTKEIAEFVTELQNRRMKEYDSEIIDNFIDCLSDSVQSAIQAVCDKPD